MKKTFIAFLIMLLIPVFAYAEEVGTEQILKNSDFSEIEEFLSKNYSALDFKKMLTDVLSGEAALDIDTLKGYVEDIFFSEIKYTCMLAVKIISVCVLLSFLNHMQAGSAADAVFFVGYLIISFILADVFLAAIVAAKDIIVNINSLINMSLPLLMVFMAGCGAAKTAACINPVILIGIEIVSVLTNVFFIPLILALGTLALFSFDEAGFDIKMLIKTIKSVLKWSMGLAFTMFGGIVSVYSTFSSSSDALSFRAAKYVVGSAVPVVGSLISETMGTFTYSCAVVKNAFGTVVICIIIFIVISPVIKLFMISTMLNISTVLISGISDKKITCAASEMSSAVSHILALVVLTAFLFIICIAIIIHTANNIII